MVAQKQLIESIEGLHQTATDADLWSTLYSILKLCNVSVVAYHHLPPPGAVDYSQNFRRTVSLNATGDDIREDILHQYFEKNIRKGGRDLNDHQFWSLTPQEAKALGEDKMIDAKLPFPSKVIQGVTFPVHGPGGRNGCFSVVLGAGVSAEDCPELRVIEWACQNAHQKFCKIQIDKNGSLPKLTDREVEILTWVARGKSNGVIAQILEISPHTVNTYMRRIFLKMGISDRTTVALAGLNNGLIEL
ncbi:LuxR family transcriptional regulator [Litorimonas taeanensis]|uniref:LuxR family transcriptional regulator n=1 Tax=Litorimonas taeanensis TaxID=568099 RepID=A0A420WJN3_9PROT|nr:LuxR family transcriptional regulator [Litorimonas taeanensis]RKQ71149.1 LuxR family transcriptional regulator [Litorimonas taeanensis]